MKQILLIILVILLFTACAEKKTGKQMPISSTEAVSMAAASELSKVVGVFALTIQSSGNQKDMTYLNSELDYRDPQNLSIEFPAIVRGQLIEKYGTHPIQFFKGKKILVEGEAKRIKIYRIIRGIRTDKYYYQTHIRVNNSEQIMVL